MRGRCSQIHLLPGYQLCLFLTYLFLWCPGHQPGHSWEGFLVTAPGLMQQLESQSCGISGH